MKVTTNWISAHYVEYNSAIFGGALPDIKFKVSKSETYGLAGYLLDVEKCTVEPTYIAVSGKYDRLENSYINTLVHEMIHIYDYVSHPEHYVVRNEDGSVSCPASEGKYDCHGEWFISQIQRVNAMRYFNFELTSGVADWEDKGVLKDIFCIVNRKNDDPGKAWGMFKISPTTFKKMKKQVEEYANYYSKYYIAVEWYRCDDGFGSLFRNRTDLKSSNFEGSFSDSEKNSFVERHKLGFLDKIVLDTNYEKPKPSDFTYTLNFEVCVSVAISRIEKMPDFKATGVGSYSMKESSSDITFGVNINKKTDVVTVTFNNNAPLTFSYKKYKIDRKNSLGFQPYGDMILNHLRSNKLLEGRGMMNLKTIINEVINSYVANNSVDDGVTVTGNPGKRNVSKSLNNRYIVGYVE